MQLYYIANAIVSGLRTTALSRNSLSSSHHSHHSHYSHYSHYSHRSHYSHKNIRCAILWNDSVLGVRGPVSAKKPRKKVRKNLAVDEKGRTFALAFREWRRRHASRGAEKLKSVKRCRTFWQRQKSAVTLQTLSGRKNAFRDTRKNEHIERITIDKVVVRELKKINSSQFLTTTFTW